MFEPRFFLSLIPFQLKAVIFIILEKINHIWIVIFAAYLLKILKETHKILLLNAVLADPVHFGPRSDLLKLKVGIRIRQIEYNKGFFYFFLKTPWLEIQ